RPFTRVSVHSGNRQVPARLSPPAGVCHTREQAASRLKLRRDIMANAKPQTRKETTSTVDFVERIRQRAFELFQLRGCQYGHDFDDWRQAEAEVRGKPLKLGNLRVVR